MTEYSEARYQRVGPGSNGQISQDRLADSASMRAVIGGSAGMNGNSGGPHILLFERDQQLTALLISQFQLAGYECHPARTAVEVFDAIARYPIRLVLVNLAQAATSRREFWVALDTQRRGRRVQVFTYRCMNIAGYGEDDSDEAASTVLTDLEVDGMQGVMNLVDAVRSRIPGPAAGSFSQSSAVPTTTNAQEPVSPDTPKWRAERTEPAVTPQGISQTATPFSTLSPDPAPSPTQTGPVEVARMNRPGNPLPGFAEKIRAVIYPSSRSFSPLPETSWVPHNPQNPVSTQRQNLQAPPGAPGQEESGLAQLSRMIRENHTTDQSEVGGSSSRTRGYSGTSPVQRQGTLQSRPQMSEPQGYGEELRTIVQQARPVDATTISGLPLRASPIEDIPIELEHEHRSGQTGAQTPVRPSVNSSAASTPPAVSPSSKTMSSPVNAMSFSPVEEDLKTDKQEDVTTEEENASDFTRTLAEQPHQNIKHTLTRPSSTSITSDDTLLNIVQSLPPISSLPTPPLQAPPPVLSGRATRALGSVLLEGHLVPQERLEVAQRIQRMLRGVDLNYQLGEILLMFKLLTPDQLLAASLVSYGLISTAQISALGRIRQEVHSIGLEYDLEGLLVLFRILTPEQLREVRASWSG
jgi:hypothetical protein